MSLHRAGQLQRVGADHHADALRQPLRHALQARSLAHGLFGDVGKTDGVEAGVLQRAQAAAQQQHADYDCVRRVGIEQTIGGDRARGENGVDQQHLPEAKAPEYHDGEGFHEHGAAGGGATEQTGVQRVEAEAQLKHQRQQEGRRAHAGAKQAATDDAGAERRELEQAKVDQRLGGPARVPGIGGEGHGAGDDAGGGDGHGQQVPAEGGKTQHHHRQADAQQHEAAHIQARQRAFADVGDEAQHQYQAEDADRHIDQEYAAPVEVLRDEAAQRRAHDGAEQRREGEVVERFNQFAFGYALEQHQASDRNHHRPSDALDEACQHEGRQRARQGAAQRAGHEDHNGPGENGA